MLGLSSNLVIVLAVSIWIAYCLSHVWVKVFSDHGLPKSLPWPEDKRDFWSRGKSTLQSFFGTQGILERGYRKYSKKGQAFVLPNLIFGPEVIIPPTQMQWLLDQPESIMSQFEANKKTVSGDITFLHPDILANRINTPVIENEMNKKQDTYADDQIDEIQYALSMHWGNDSRQWKDIPVYNSLDNLMTRLMARTFVGLPLCRDEGFLHSAGRFNALIPITAYIDQLSVPILKPLMVRLAHVYDKVLYRRIRRTVLPIITERIPAFQSRALVEKRTKTKMPEDFGPNDYIQWALKYAFADGTFNPRETPELIAKQLAIFQFATSRSTAVSLANVIFDIAAHSDSTSLQSILREEITQVITRQRRDNPEAKAFGRSNLNQMVHLDSAIRESLRRWGFSSRGVQKTVMPPEGINLPTGEHIPQGTFVGISGWTLHQDESIYKDALEYKPFRFSDKDNFAEIESLYGKGKVPPGGASMTSTGDRYLVFSHGRWACPGRFFAQNNLKRIVAQVLLNYDIEPLQSRPPVVWFNNLIGPPMTETIRVKRRTAEV